MAVFRTKWQAAPETFDFEAPDPLEALRGLARETVTLTGLARVSSVTITKREVEAKGKGKTKPKLIKVETVVPLVNPIDNREVWEQIFAMRPTAQGATLLSQGQRPMMGTSDIV
jgi:hypothetical protein